MLHLASAGSLEGQWEYNEGMFSSIYSTDFFLQKKKKRKKKKGGKTPSTSEI